VFYTCKTKLCIGLWRSPALESAEGVLELPANGIVDEEVDGAVDGKEQMTDSGKDRDPYRCLVTQALCIMDGGEEGVHCQVQDESGHVEDDIDQDNGDQSRVTAELPIFLAWKLFGSRVMFS
jgi:hypothetical protein